MMSARLCSFPVEHQCVSLFHSTFPCRMISVENTSVVSTFHILPVLSVSLVTSFSIHASLLPSLPPFDCRLPDCAIGSFVCVISTDRVKKSLFLCHWFILLLVGSLGFLPTLSLSCICYLLWDIASHHWLDLAPAAVKQ